MRWRARGVHTIAAAAALAAASLAGACDLVFGVEVSSDAGPRADADPNAPDADPNAPDAAPVVIPAQQLTFDTGDLDLREISECYVVEVGGGQVAYFTARAGASGRRRTFSASSTNGVDFANVDQLWQDLNGLRDHAWPRPVPHNNVPSPDGQQTAVTISVSDEAELAVFYQWSKPNTGEWEGQINNLSGAAPLETEGAIFALTSSSRMAAIQVVGEAPGMLVELCRPSATWGACPDVSLDALRSEGAADRTPVLIGSVAEVPSSLYFARQLPGERFDLYTSTRSGGAYGAPTRVTNTPEYSELGPSLAVGHWYFTVPEASYPRCFRVPA